MQSIMPIISSIATPVFITLGLVFWFWGTREILSSRSVLFKLHSLSVSDTLGSIAILVGLLFQRPREFPLLLLAILSLALWNTMLGYVLAYCANRNVNLPGTQNVRHLRG